MKEIKAIIRRSALYPVLMAVRAIPDMPGLLVSELRAFPRGHPESSSASHGIDALDSVEMLEIQCVVSDEMHLEAVEAIRGAAHTGSPGDGRIFVCDVERAIEIRTGQPGKGPL